MKDYEPELGQAVYGNPYKRYDLSTSDPLYSALEAIRRFIEAVYWEDELDPFANGGEELKGDTFHIQAYSWADCYCGAYYGIPAPENCTCGYKEQKYNFRWDGTDEIEPIVVSWYKYFPRGISVNRSSVLEEVQIMLREIISYLIEKN